MTNKKDGPIKSYKLRMKNRVHWSIKGTEEQVRKEHARIDKTGTSQSDSIQRNRLEISSVNPKN